MPHTQFKMAPWALGAAFFATACATTATFAQTPHERAQEHFDAIGEGRVEAIMQNYAEDAVFQWVGGPLDGVYMGADDIKSVWSKFTKAQGELKVSVSDLRTDANPKGATVSAAVKFEGAKTVPVFYVITFRDGKIANEIWQINPASNKY